MYVQSQTYQYPNAKEIEQRVNYIERVIAESSKPNSDIKQLAKEFHEWELFAYSFSTYALTNVALNDSAYKNRAVETIKIAIDQVLKAKIANNYDVDSSALYSDSIPDLSVLYHGHLNLMMGCYRKLTTDSTYNKLNNKLSKSLYEKYEASPYYNLESYSESIWIPDNTVALASLQLHNANTGSSYHEICKKWVSYAKEHYLESETGTLYSTIDYKIGDGVEEPRGSMLGWSIMFIYQFDTEFATQLYQNYKKAFSQNYHLLMLFRERHNNYQSNDGDVDSGPIFQGFSIPANEFALSNAVLAGDYKTAAKLQRLINLGTKTINDNSELRYKLRFFDMKISPMAEALVLHSLTMTKWTK